MSDHSALDAFRARCEAGAAKVAAGEMDRIEAIDGLEHAAASDGIVDEIGQDGVQAALAEAFFGSIEWRPRSGKGAATEYKCAHYCGGHHVYAICSDQICRARRHR